VSRSAVLVVDDEVPYTGVLQEILNSYGLNAVISHRAEHALAILESLQPRLILLDMMLPEMDGLTMLRNIRGREGFRNTPVIMVSAKVLPDEKKSAFSAGATGFLAKPFNARELRAAIRPYVPVPATGTLNPDAVPRASR
jgi:CheY-like chemotaxis protein